MAKFTKKWLKDFEKRFKDTFLGIQSLEKEYEQMELDNPDRWELNRWYTIENLTFERASNLSIYHQDKKDDCEEFVEIGVDGGKLSGFAFRIYELKELIEFRNKLTDAIDQFDRPIEKVKTINVDECDEDNEDPDNMSEEDVEYTIQASRTCVQVWTHTVMARSECDAIRKIQDDSDGSTHDQNDDYTDYGEIDYESI